MDIAERQSKGTVIDALAEMAEKALLDEMQLAGALHVSTRTVRRMVRRGELPPPIKLGSRSVWMAGRILNHIEEQLESVRKTAERERERLRKMME